MRRAVRHGWLHRHRASRSWRRSPSDVIDEMGGVYPELRERASLIGKIIVRGGEAVPRDARPRPAASSTRSDSRRVETASEMLPGEVVFKLYDTFGFPLDLTRVIAEERGWTVDEAGFEAAMAEQRERSEFDGSGEVGGRRRVQEGRRARRRDAVPRLRRHARRRRRSWRCVADGNEVEAVGRTRSASPSSPPRRRSTASRAARSATPARSRAAQGQGARRRREAAGVDAVRAPRRGDRGRAARRRHVDARRSTTSAATPSAATTRRRTSCTWRSHGARRARRAEGLAGRARSPALRLLALRADDAPTERQRVEDLVNARVRANAARADRGAARSTRPRRPARSRCSARSTATRCAS